MVYARRVTIRNKIIYYCIFSLRFSVLKRSMFACHGTTITITFFHIFLVILSSFWSLSKRSFNASRRNRVIGFSLIDRLDLSFWIFLFLVVSIYIYIYIYISFCLLTLNRNCLLYFFLFSLFILSDLVKYRVIRTSKKRYLKIRDDNDLELYARHHRILIRSLFCNVHV